MITVETIRRTQLTPLFWESKNKRSVKKYLELRQYLDNCDDSFIQTLSSIEGYSVGDSPTILHSIIDIHNLTEFLADGDGDKQTRDLLKPLLVVATAHQIDEITF